MMINKGSALIAGLVRRGAFDKLANMSSSASRYQVYITRYDMPECGVDLLKKE